MSYDGRAVANFVLDFCESKNRAVSNLALQKIVFFCHAWSLVRLRRPLVKHHFEAWKHGPVLQYLYQEFKRYGNEPIRTRSCRMNRLTGEQEIVPSEFDEETKKLLAEVVDFYSRIRPFDLRSITHVQGGPWDKAWNHGGKVNPGMRIEEREIASFYSRTGAPFSLQ